MPHMSQRHRVAARAGSPGAAGPVIAWRAPYQNKRAEDVRADIHKAIRRGQATVRQMSTTMGLTRSEIITAGRAIKYELDVPTDRMVPFGAASNPAEILLQIVTPGAGHWARRALCAETDPDAFFPEKGGSVRDAKKVCRNCPVQRECLEDAFEHDDRFGIWGGTSERQRRTMKREAA